MKGDKAFYSQYNAEAEKEIRALKCELHYMKNELCQYCGKYRNAHEGACDRCRWRDV